MALSSFDGAIILRHMVKAMHAELEIFAICASQFKWKRDESDCYYTLLILSIGLSEVVVRFFAFFCHICDGCFCFATGRRLHR